MTRVRPFWLGLTAAVFASVASLVAQSGPPAPPTNLAASASGSTVTITWQPGAGAAPTGYQLEAAATPSGAAIASVPVASTGLTAPSVPDGTYYLRVRAVNAAGVSAPSAEVSVTVGVPACGAVPAAPVNLTQVVSGGVVTLTWTHGSGGCPPAHYVLSAGSQSGLADLASVNLGAITAFSTPAPPGTYFLRVAAANAWGTSAASNEVVVTIGPSCVVPGAPEAFVATATGTLASFQWQPPLTGGVPSNYLLEAGTTPSGAELTVVPLNGLSFAAQAPPGSYYLRVRAQNACGTGPASSTQLLTVGGCSAPGTPGTPTVTVAGTTASLAWPVVSGATQYQVEVGTAAGASNVGVQTVTSTSAQLTALAPGTYFTRVRALNACGPGATSGEATFTIAPPPSATRIISLSGNLAFGSVTVGQTKSATLTITNSGTGTLTFTGLSCTCNVNVFSASPTSGTVPPGGSRTVTVYFAPLAATSYTGTLSVASDATAGNGSIAVSGTGVTSPPPPLPGFHVWGGPGYTQYLGFWTCTFCVEYGANSINNLYGTYGSEYSATSIRNNYGQYGSPYSSYSACNPYASSPPLVFNEDGSVYYGELTLNQYRAEAITASGVVSWLANDVCK